MPAQLDTPDTGSLSYEDRNAGSKSEVSNHDKSIIGPDAMEVDQEFSKEDNEQKTPNAYENAVDSKSVPSENSNGSGATSSSDAGLEYSARTSSSEDAGNGSSSTSSRSNSSVNGTNSVSPPQEAQTAEPQTGSSSSDSNSSSHQAEVKSLDDATVIIRKTEEDPPVQVNQTPFIQKLYSMLEDRSLNTVITWSPTEDSFFINPGEQFSRILCLYFKHTNITSFVRQLSMYGFHKISQHSRESSRFKAANDPKQSGSLPSFHNWEFKHAQGSFRRNDYASLRTIKRRSTGRQNRRKKIERHVVVTQGRDRWTDSPIAYQQHHQQQQQQQFGNHPHSASMTMAQPQRQDSAQGTPHPSHIQPTDLEQGRTSQTPSQTHQAHSHHQFSAPPTSINSPHPQQSGSLPLAILGGQVAMGIPLPHTVPLRQLDPHAQNAPTGIHQQGSQGHYPRESVSLLGSGPGPPAPHGQPGAVPDGVHRQPPMPLPQGGGRPPVVPQPQFPGNEQAGKGQQQQQPNMVSSWLSSQLHNYMVYPEMSYPGAAYAPNNNGQSQAQLPHPIQSVASEELTNRVLNKQRQLESDISNLQQHLRTISQSAGDLGLLIQLLTASRNTEQSNATAGTPSSTHGQELGSTNGANDQYRGPQGADSNTNAHNIPQNIPALHSPHPVSPRQQPYQPGVSRPNETGFYSNGYNNNNMHPNHSSSGVSDCTSERYSRTRDSMVTLNVPSNDERNTDSNSQDSSERSTIGFSGNSGSAGSSTNGSNGTSGSTGSSSSDRDSGTLDSADSNEVSGKSSSSSSMSESSANSGESGTKRSSSGSSSSSTGDSYEQSNEDKMVVDESSPDESLKNKHHSMNASDNTGYSPSMPVSGTSAPTVLSEKLQDIAKPAASLVDRVQLRSLLN